MRGVSDTTAIAGATPWRQGFTPCENYLDGSHCRAGPAHKGVRTQSGKPRPERRRARRPYDEVISGYAASEPEVLVTDARSLQAAVESLAHLRAQLWMHVPPVLDYSRLSRLNWAIFCTK
jgi:hypothetical protein